MSTFPPLNPLVSTDNVQYPGAWLLIMLIVSTGWVMIGFTHCFRTMSNVWKPELGSANPLSKLVSMMENPWLIWQMVSYAFWMGIAIMFIVWAFTVYSTQLGTSPLLMPRDVSMVVCASVSGLWLVLMFSLMIYHVYLTFRRREEWEKVAMLNCPVGNLNKGTKILGFHPVTTGRVRYLIYAVNAALFQLAPLTLSTFVLVWDRTKDEPVSLRHLPDWQIYITFLSGLLQYVGWVIYCFYNIGALDRLFLDPLYSNSFFSPSHLESFNEKIGVRSPKYQNAVSVLNAFYSTPNYFRFGFSADVLGNEMPFKGMIPVSYVTPFSLVARSIQWFAIAFGIFNDQKQAFAFWAVVSFWPTFLSIIAGGAQWYIALEMSFLFWFSVMTYFVQGVMMFGNTQQNYNFNLLTVSQSGTFPLAQPAGTTAEILVVGAFILACVNILVVLRVDDKIKLDPVPKSDDL